MTRSIASLDKLATESAWLRKLARTLVGEHAAEDLVHDTYLVAATKPPTDDRPFEPWLARVMRNLAGMRGRASRRRLAREHELGKLAAPPAKPDELAARVETQRMLAGLVLDLPQTERDVVLLHYFEGLTSVEIGRRLGIPEGTVRWRMKQALDELRSKLDERDARWTYAVGALAHPRHTIAFKAIVVALLVVLLACLGLRRMLAPVEETGGPQVMTETSDPGFVGPAASVLAQLAQDRQMCQSMWPPPSWATGTAGVVLDPSGHPVAGATVQCGEKETSTADDGTFTLPDRSGWGWCPTPSARKGNLVGISPWVDAGERAVIRVYPNAFVLHAREVDETPIPGATVTLYDERYAIIERLVTDHRGSVTVSNRVNASVVLTAPGHTSRHYGASPQGGPCTDMPCEYTARLYAMGEHIVEGRVLDHLGQPVGGIRVTAHPTQILGDSIPDEGALSDIDGNFQLWAEEADAYTINALEPLTEAASVVIVPATSTTGLTIRLEPPRYPRFDIEVTVVDLQDRPVQYAELLLAAPPVRTDAQGRAKFVRSARGGELRIAARHDGDASEEQRIPLVDPHDHAHSMRSTISITLRLLPSRLAGVVVDERGLPVSHARVSVILLNEWTGVTTDDDGRFSVTPSRGHRYTLDVQGPPCRDGHRILPLQARLVVDAPSEDLRIVVHPETRSP